MKKGKTSKIQGFKTAKVIYGTVDSLQLKSIYLNIQAWVEPKKETDNWSRIVLNLSRAIKHSIYDKIKDSIFDDKYIVDLDLRSSGLSVGKKSFLNLEINLFIEDEKLNFKSKIIKDTLKKLTKNIFEDNFKSNNYFKLHLRKTTKEKDLQTI